MDQLTQSQLLILEAGGNAQFQKYLEMYDLQEESHLSRYFSKAVQFYRVKLKELVENGYFNERINWSEITDKPSYEDGRESVRPLPRQSELNRHASETST